MARTDLTSPTEPPAGHEPNYVSTRVVRRFLIGLAVSGVFVAALVWGVFQVLNRDARSLDRPLSAGVRQQLSRQPPAPRLEARPLALRSRLNAREDALLTSYGWIDRSAGTVRIPVDRAMDLIVHRGLPKTATAPASSPPAAPVSGPASAAAAATRSVAPRGSR